MIYRQPRILRFFACSKATKHVRCLRGFVLERKRYYDAFCFLSIVSTQPGVSPSYFHHNCWQNSALRRPAHAKCRAKRTQKQRNCRKRACLRLHRCCCVARLGDCLSLGRLLRSCGLGCNGLGCLLCRRRRRCGCWCCGFRRRCRRKRLLRMCVTHRQKSRARGSA